MTEHPTQSEGERQYPRALEVETARELAEKGLASIGAETLESYARFIGEYLDARTEGLDRETIRGDDALVDVAGIQASYYDELAVRKTAAYVQASRESGPLRQAARTIRNDYGIHQPNTVR